MTNLCFKELEKDHKCYKCAFLLATPVDHTCGSSDHKINGQARHVGYVHFCTIAKSFSHTIGWVFIASFNDYILGKSGQIIELVDSISRDGQDTPIYVIHNKIPKSSVQLQFQDV